MAQLIQSPRYIYPPRPTSSIPLDEAKKLNEMGFKFQLKFADTRNLIHFNPDGSITLWNRHNQKQKQFSLSEELKAELLVLKEKLGIEDGKFTIIDGGILHNKTKFIKNTLVVWDILVLNNEYLTGTTYQERYQKLLDCSSAKYYIKDIYVGEMITDNVFVAATFDIGNDLDNKWSDLMKINEAFGWSAGSGDPAIEGVILKDVSGKLKIAFKEENNTDWSVRCRIPTKRNGF